MAPQTATNPSTNTSDTELFTVHMKLDIEGTPEAIEHFHTLCSWIDEDWPYHHDNTVTKSCRKCGGVLYTNPLIAPQDVKMAAHHTGAQVKIHRFCQDSVCNPQEHEFIWQANSRHIETRQHHHHRGLIRI